MPKKSASPATATVLAAGAVLWRPACGSDAVEVAVVHRPRYDDWSLPKGKVDPGETEAGHRGARGRGGDGLRGRAGPAADVGQLSRGAGHQEGSVLGGARTRWRVQPERRGRQTALAARRRRDEAPAVSTRSKGAAPLRQTTCRHQTVLIVRHGVAGTKSRYKGDDRKRPLDKRGRAQAESLVGQLLAFGATDLYAAAACAVPPDARAAGRGVGCDDPRRAGADRGGLRRRPRDGRRRVAGDRRSPTAHR